MSPISSWDPIEGVLQTPKLSLMTTAPSAVALWIIWRWFFKGDQWVWGLGGCHISTHRMGGTHQTGDCGGDLWSTRRLGSRVGPRGTWLGQVDLAWELLEAKQGHGTWSGGAAERPGRSGDSRPSNRIGLQEMTRVQGKCPSFSLLFCATKDAAIACFKEPHMGLGASEKASMLAHTLSSKPLNATRRTMLLAGGTI